MYWWVNGWCLTPGVWQWIIGGKRSGVWCPLDRRSFGNCQGCQCHEEQPSFAKLGTLIMHVGDSYYRFFQGSWVGGGVSLVKVSRVKVGAWCGNALRCLHKIYLANWTQDRPKSACFFYQMPYDSNLFRMFQLPETNETTILQYPAISPNLGHFCQMVSEKLPAVVVLEDWSSGPLRCWGWTPTWLQYTGLCR